MPADIPDPDLRWQNAKIAEGYDLVPYEAEAVPSLDPDRVFGLAALYGDVAVGADLDVLDLGCGAGRQLERVAGLTRGRLVGTDLSRSACDRAALRLAKVGPRCHIQCADFLDLDAAALGQFDIIYHIGVLYVTPPAVQRRILDLITACLKPGGVAVISYYFGTTPLIMGGLRQIVGAAIDPNAAPRDQIHAARACLQNITAALTAFGDSHKGLLGLLQQVQGRDDTIFFHEMLGGSFMAVSTVALEANLSRAGIHFLNWLITPGPFGLTASPRERALMADSFDLAGGGYHYATFRKSEASRPLNLRAGNVLWHSRLARAADSGDKPVFKDSLGGTVTPSAATAAMLDVLAQGPCDWTTLSQAWERILAGRGATASQAFSLLEQEFLKLWQYGLLAPGYLLS